MPRFLTVVTLVVRVCVIGWTPVVLYLWITHDPANCLPDWDFLFIAAAIGLLAVSAVPIVCRMATGSGFREAWTLRDSGLVVCMVALLLYMGSGEGRMVVYGNCGIVDPSSSATAPDGAVRR